MTNDKNYFRSFASLSARDAVSLQLTSTLKTLTFDGFGYASSPNSCIIEALTAPFLFLCLGVGQPGSAPPPRFARSCPGWRRPAGLGVPDVPMGDMARAGWPGLAPRAGP